MVQLDESLISSLLTQLDSISFEQVNAISMTPQSGGGSGSWRCSADDGNDYIIKCINNQHENRSRPELPLKMLTLELVCGRLGQLFSPSITPKSLVVNVPPSLCYAPHPQNNVFPAAGPAFGSRFSNIPVISETKSWFTVSHLPKGVLARYLVFTSWLYGEDVQALILANNSLLSIDHGWYLVGGGEFWEQNFFSNPPPLILKSFGDYQQGILNSPLDFQFALDELSQIDEKDIVKACSGFPSDWRFSLSYRVPLVSLLLKRRDDLISIYSGGNA